jgi:DNA-binding NarL/FixJ family response regulator
MSTAKPLIRTREAPMSDSDDTMTIVVQVALPLVRDAVLRRVSRPGVVARGVSDLGELASWPWSDSIDVVVLECDDDATDERIRAIRTAFDDVAVVGVHSDLPAARIRALRDAGARCLVDRSSGLDALVAAVFDPHRATRRRWVTPSIGPVALSSRETDVLSLVADGLTVREIAERLGVSNRTVEGHKQRAFAKLGVQNQSHAVSVAMRSSQIRPEVAVG